MSFRARGQRAPSRLTPQPGKGEGGGRNQIERWTKDPWDAALVFVAPEGAQTGEKGEYVKMRVPERFESALRRGAMPQSVLHQVAKDEGMGALFKGAGANALRTVGSALVLVMYGEIKDMLSK